MISRARRVKLEAAAYLVLARLALALVPFRRLSRWFTRPLAAAELHEPDRIAARREVGDAVAAAARRLPGTTVCFPQAIAAQAMLRRRGVPTSLHYGASSAEGSLTGHVWLSDGDEGIVGVETPHRYQPLLTYSSTRRPVSAVGNRTIGEGTPTEDA